MKYRCCLPEDIIENQEKKITVMISLSYLNRSTIFSLWRIFFTWSSLAGAHSLLKTLTTNCASLGISRIPWFACCFIRSKSRTSLICALSELWWGSSNDSIFWNKTNETWNKAMTILYPHNKVQFCPLCTSLTSAIKDKAWLKTGGSWLSSSPSLSQNALWTTSLTRFSRLQ